VDKLIK